MSPATIITIIKSILCQPELKTWLERQAAISIADRRYGAEDNLHGIRM